MRLSFVYGLVALAFSVIALFGGGLRLLSLGTYDVAVFTMFAIGLGSVLLGVVCLVLLPKIKIPSSRLPVSGTSTIWVIRKILVALYWGTGVSFLAEALWGPNSFLGLPRPITAGLGFVFIYLAYRHSEQSKGSFNGN